MNTLYIQTDTGLRKATPEEQAKAYNHRHYYAAHSYMGIGYTYDSPCWVLYVFCDKASREEWLTENEYSNGNLVAEAVSAKIARKIAPNLPSCPHGVDEGRIIWCY